MTEDLDIVVIGAGPAGAAAATMLASAGREVTVFDRAVFPREKCCGDGLTTLALRELERLGFDPRALKSWMAVDEVVVQGPRGREARFPLPSEAGLYAAVARRADLDTALVGHARAAGAEIRENTGLMDATAREDGVDLVVGDSQSVTARTVIGADGMWSPLRKALGLSTEGYRGEWHAFRQYYRNVGPRAASELVIWFEPDLLPGYAWSFPLSDGRANVGFGIRRGGQLGVGEMKQLWTDLLQRPHIRDLIGADAEPEAPHKAWPIPARVGRVPLHAPHTLFVGDAAAVTDPMTGEGIGQALLTGRLAAEAILAGSGDATADDAGARYESEVRRELVADDRMARLLVPLLTTPLALRGVLRLTGATPWTRRNFARWLFEDYPRAMIATPRRWHRGMFTGPGAFAE